ncbi:hypothetical protein EAE96_011364 [Botrytis aclada]|nr:hypothetical protein EAE96_011364 [Botrytis aclada]
MDGRELLISCEKKRPDQRQSVRTFLVTLYNDPSFLLSEGPTSITTPLAAHSRISTRFTTEHLRNNYGQYLISLKNPSHPSSLPAATPIGSVCLTKGDDADPFDVPDVGFALISAAQGKGYATEAARALLEYVEREQGLVSYFGFTSPGNGASRRVMEKLGMVDLGVQRSQGKETYVFASPAIEDLKKYGFKK